jgi:hypothetical protein
VHEHIVASIAGLDEAVTLLGIEPLDSSRGHAGFLYTVRTDQRDQILSNTRPHRRTGAGSAGSIKAIYRDRISCCGNFQIVLRPLIANLLDDRSIMLLEILSKAFRKFSLCLLRAPFGRRRTRLTLDGLIAFSAGSLADVRCCAPRLVHREDVGNVSVGFCLPPVDVSERLTISIDHLVAAWNLFDGPWWREAADILFSHAALQQRAFWDYAFSNGSMSHDPSELLLSPDQRSV